ncbi:MAG: hypothetical protein AAGC60_06115 [Acidobacteriota bacterium]
MTSDADPLALASPTNGSRLEPIFRALRFAAAKHSLQKRKGPSEAPYVNQLIAVARLLVVEDVCTVLEDPSTDRSRKRRAQALAWVRAEIERLRGAHPELKAYFDELVERAGSPRV